MRRTGSGPLLTLLLSLSFAAAARADVEFYQTVDHTEVGVEDTFRLTVVVSDAPEGAQLKFPASDELEVLSTQQSTQASYQLGGGGSGVIQRVQKYVRVMRANRVGTVRIPSAVLTTSNKTYRTEAIALTVKKGRLYDSQAQAQRQQLPDPFRNFPFPNNVPDPFRGGDESDAPDIDIPSSDSDLILRATVDKQELYVGEQATLSLYIFSRVDLSSVDQVSMPKLDGFWSEDVESPNQLAGEQKIINGVPYRAYLLKRRALFPVKAGKVTIDSAEADITTGFLFAGHRVHRKSNEIALKVKPLPPGAPPGISNSQVGEWRLTTEVSQTQVELGAPVTVRVVLQGRGNLKGTTPPPLTGPPALKIYDPTTTDRPAVNRGKISGQRTQEYLVMAQQTGTFTLPGLAFPFFNPETQKYEVSRTDPITLVVTPGAGGTTALSRNGPAVAGEGPAKNVLTAGGLRSLRHAAAFQPKAEPAWRRPFFLPALLSPVGLWLTLSIVGLVRSRLSQEDDASRKSKQAREARRRLAAAEKLKAKGKADAFFGEVEKALLQFLEAKLGIPVGGLRREDLTAQLTQAGVAEEQRARLIAVLDDCDVGRFAPGAAGPEARDRVLAAASAAMEAWGRK